MLHARLLRYLDEVARCGSIRKAGDRLNVAASAINRQILGLEQDLGTPLFQRLPGRLVPTAAGEILLRHVGETLRAMDQARLQIEEIKGLRRGEISIAVISGLAGTILPMAISRFRETHSHTRFNLILLPKAEIMARISDGDVDLGLGFNLPADDKVAVLASVPSRLGIVVSSKHPLAAKKNGRFVDCLDYPLCVADPDTAIRTLINAAAAAAGVEFEPYVETNSVEVMRHMAAHEGCVTFLSTFDIYPELVAGNFVYLPIDGSPFMQETVDLIGRHRSFNVLVGGMIDQMSQLLHDCAHLSR
jgi:DNA-binding transcriptional LysR family regulator